MESWQDRYNMNLGKLSSGIDEGDDWAKAVIPEPVAPVTPPAAASGSAAGNAGQLAGTAGTFAINPYLGAAGLGLQAYGMIAQQKQQEREAEYTAKLQRISKIQDSLAGLANSGMGLSRL
jgi:hypothetical protein